MATFLNETSFPYGNGSHFRLRLYYDISQNREQNYSDVTYYEYFASVDGYSGSGAAANGYINDTLVGSTTSVGRNSEVYLGSKTVRYNHNNEGVGSAGYSASITCSWGIGNASLSGTLSLPTISRVAKINSFIGNDVEGTFSATYTKYISDWTEKLRISIPNVVALMTINNYESGDGVTLDSASITTIQNYMNTNGTNQVVLGGVIETWSGNTKIGESVEINNICTFINAEPTFTYTTTETNQNVISLLGASSGTVIQNASNLRINTTPTAYKGASISKVEVVHSDKTYTDTTSPYSVDVLVTTNSFTIKTTDNRTNNASQTFTKTMIEYQPVDITSLTMERQNPTSSNIILNLEAKYYQKTFGQTANAPTVKWKLDDGTYTTIPSTEYTIDTTNNKLTIYNYTLSNALVYTSNGTITIEISDLLTSDTDGATVLKGIATWDAGEHDLQVNGDLYIADTNRENARKITDLDLYSTSEIRVGTWIDNKPIYRKVITGSKSYVVSQAAKSNLGYDVIVKATGWMYSHYYQWWPMPSYHSETDYFIAIYWHNTGIGIDNGAHFDNNSDTILILDYTKTTN